MSDHSKINQFVYFLPLLLSLVKNVMAEEEVKEEEKEAEEVIIEEGVLLSSRDLRVRIGKTLYGN